MSNHARKRKRFEKMDSLDLQRHHIAIFNTVFEPYQETRVTSSSTSCEQLYVLFKDMVNGLTSGASNNKIVRATASDFVADVELAIAKVTTRQEYQNLVHLEQPATPELQAKIGAEFRRRKIVPLKAYFRPKAIV